jgi:membrane peptidoglycan carboxypeptidase
VLLFSSFLVLGGVGFVGTVSGYAYYSRDLPDPLTLFTNLQFDQPSLVFDRTGQVQLASFGDQHRRIITFDEVPPELVDATTSIEDKDFWTNPGFDLGGFVAATIDTLTGHPRGGSTITQQLVRDRLLPASAFTGSVYDRKIKEIIQSIRLTQALPPGDAGKKKIMEAYLNQNFYGNQSYGVAAAALGYFGKDLKDLDLAQDAILAALPQSPTEYDLVHNAVENCTVAIAANETCPASKIQLVVPASSAIVQRRNTVLQLMETRSVLTAGKHTIAEYQAAMNEPVILASQAVPQWLAPHFVWQVRDQLSKIVCGADSTQVCQQIDTGGYQVTTTLDYSMQKTVEKWLYVVAQTVHMTNPSTIWANLGIPKADYGWLTNLKIRNLYNGAAGIMDYRTGQVLAYAGSAGYYLPGSAKFQPQFDIMSDGFRQPGSAIKPLNYITGINDHTLTAATSFMHLVTDFGTAGHSFAPQEVDGLERGPIRLRSALEFSFNIASVKAGLINGLAHVFANEQNFGLHFPPGSTPVASQSIGTLEVHPIDLLGAFGAIADGGTLMPRTMILEVRDHNGNVIYPTTTTPPAGKPVASPQAAYIITDILAGNTIKAVNPIWAQWTIFDGKTRRPAAYKTGTTDNYKDVSAYGFLAPPADPKAPALVAGAWMGNSDGTPNNKSLSLDSVAPLWSRILTEVSHGLPIAQFKQPSGIVSATVDAFSGLLPGPGTVRTVNELFIQGTVPTQVDNYHIPVDIDSATGLLWQAGCAGPKVTKYFLDFSHAEPGFPQWQRYTQEWAARARNGPGVVGGPDRNRTSYFYGGGFYPFGATWGGTFAPTGVCSVVPIPTPSPSPSQTPGQTPGQGGGGQGKPTPTPRPT